MAVNAAIGRDSLATALDGAVSARLAWEMAPPRYQQGDEGRLFDQLIHIVFTL
jgi:hypothetical protein